MPVTVTSAGAVVLVMGGFHRGRVGVVVTGAADRTNSVLLRLDKRSAYDANRPHDMAWVPVEYLKLSRGEA